jgi:hypothetical protein
VVDVLAGLIAAAVLIPTGNWLYFKFQKGELGEPPTASTPGARAVCPRPTA